jgi:hypothetical protein
MAPPTKKKTKKKSATATFGAALVAAEKMLADATDQRNFHASEYHRYNREIPRLQRTVEALRNQQSIVSGEAEVKPQYMPMEPGYGIAQVLSDAPIPMAAQTSQEGIPNLEMQPKRHVLAGGGAVGVQLEEEPDEDIFLKDANLPGGNWV